MSGNRITSRLVAIRGEPTAAERCAAEVDAARFLEALRPAVVEAILGKSPERSHVELVGPGADPRVLQLIVTRLAVPATKIAK